MKISIVLTYTLLGLGVASAIAMAFAPELLRQFHSGPSVKGPGSAEAAGILLLLVIGALAVMAAVSAFLAWLAARHAQSGSALRWSCWLPILLAIFASLRLYKKLMAA
jgi:hypothetical protein